MRIFLPRPYFCFLVFLFIISQQAVAQTAYDWYTRELSNRRQSDYWKSIPVDTVITLEFVNTAPSISSPGRYGRAVDLASFLRNKTIHISGNKTYASGQIYFAGKGFPVPQSSSIGLPATFEIDHLLKKCETGTTLLFDVIGLPDSGKAAYMQTGFFVLTDFQKKDLPIPTVDTCIIETMEALQKRFTRGTIYFSGTGFTAVVSLPAIESNDVNRKQLIARLQPGSTIVFDNCNYWDAVKKAAVTFNKTIKLSTSKK